jgi:NDP-sugar pyrophosphorylase family protein
MRHGFNEFLIALGYRGDVIKRHFLDYYAMSAGEAVPPRKTRRPGAEVAAPVTAPAVLVSGIPEGH